MKSLYNDAHNADERTPARNKNDRWQKPKHIRSSNVDKTMSETTVTRSSHLVSTRELCPKIPETKIRA